jgi:hypothetical protein
MFIHIKTKMINNIMKDLIKVFFAERVNKEFLYLNDEVIY